MYLKDYPEAERLLRESLALHRQGGDRGGLASTLNNLGLLAFQLNDFVAAQAHFHEALQISSEMQTLPELLDALIGLALLMNKEGHGARAVELVAFALHHPSCEQETKDRAQALLAELQAQLSPAVVEAAQAKGRARDTDDIVAEAALRGLSFPKS